MEELKSVIAQNIFELRTANDLTQLELAEKLNYSDKAVSKWERADSIPDVSVLKNIADIFGVTVDYLLTAEHTGDEAEPETQRVHRYSQKVHAAIIWLSILLVWFVATAAFVALSLVSKTNPNWLAFIIAVPVSAVVWLIMNTIWFNRRMNYLIVSLLMWTAIAAIHITFVAFGYNPWVLYLLGVPGQGIIVAWSQMKYKQWKKIKKKQ